MEQQTVHILYLEFGQKRRSDLTDYLLPLVQRLFPDHTSRLHIIDNALSPALLESRPDAKLIAGDNQNREFSGWQKAWSEICQTSIDDKDIVCLCNDTFASSYGREYLNWFRKDEVNAYLARGQAIGYVDRKDQPLRIEGFDLREWIRTSLLFIRAGELRKIQALTLPIADENLFAESGHSLFIQTAPVDPLVIDMIDWWLVQRPSESFREDEPVWHSAQHLTDQNRKSMQQKAKSILAELQFSARLGKCRVPIFDIRVSKSRAYGTYWLLNSVGLLPFLKRVRREILHQARPGSL